MSPTPPAAVIVLAAGGGTRMKSAVLPKILHPLCGRSLVGHAVAAARELTPDHLVVVVGHMREQVSAHLAEIDPGVRVVVQEEQKGTGHAARVALEALAAEGTVLDGTVVVSYGDVPLLTADTLRRLAGAHAADGNAVTVLTAEVPDATGYGRILRGPAGEVRAIVEHKDASEDERAITEINSGVYAFDGKLLAQGLGEVRTDNSQGEEYLTDVLGILREAGHRVGALVAADFRDVLGINDRVQLAETRRIMNDRLLDSAMRAGVTVVDPATTWLDVQVTYEPDALIHPNTQLQGATSIAAGAEVGPNCTLKDTRVGAGAHVSNATADQAVIGEGAQVGPYAYLRPGTVLGVRSKAGTYVEMKNAVVGDGSKVPHLTYVGDATIGEGSNIGAASVFVNYDGVNKHRTTIGSHCRTGSDNMFVAPVTVGDGAYTAAGSVIYKDVPAGALGVTRPQQRNVEGWVERKRPGTAAAEAAAAARAGSAPANASVSTPAADPEATEAAPDA
ncbi:bifunctional UDP-N-acetylglucosamine diphosphorylase/glucosamine-1-phosphate N-acetyltransferase GlmU [Streptacidiphilus sp. PB12-B1b]|uniref:bifunctional UDP-N-acetylglucosamine diphosphorylase/glucosamine-1-phosphate N-acetyltransferase GlmU n=1 Tax=Streptacidiphilus sp. PB12-B1b TaxID=2705012 RepID=UPI0015FAB270|nr:bifunctional UDP-N-acetylglucosamine diphosphorylase/glucosamine-1-phosphate N-acetyltransferase GlmU [Streptacidiphilus sp. PB12-B1b]QMU79416.1 bifunctional UDP-N-acetylglucosamine diphosphorylase/glucosamine-1-phosphate N-acetyltransferase GlmU [Streptacidiphilus sp. PB12-B1b]